MKVTSDVKKAYKLACAARKNAHAPYSHFQVGAVLKIKGKDEFVQGCNVENASYGATVCAERTAFQASVVKFGKPKFEFLVVVTNTDPAIGPCGLCLQVIAEFCDRSMPIYLANPKEIQTKTTFGELLHQPFSKIPKQVNG